MKAVYTYSLIVVFIIAIIIYYYAEKDKKKGDTYTESTESCQITDNSNSADNVITNGTAKPIHIPASWL